MISCKKITIYVVLLKKYKKFKRWYRQKICNHRYVEIRNPETDEFINECETSGKWITYSYVTEYQCVNCGKIEYLGSGQIFTSRSRGVEVYE
jgi:predicted RNA-binding Zn-ribbon protein involved in translation (DUF1610 family)